MATVNPADTIVSIVKETVPGVTNATPAFRYVDVTNAGVTMNITAAELTSDTMSRNRAMADFRKGPKSASGTIPTVFQRSDVVTDIMAGVMSAVNVNGTYKGSNKDTSYTIEKAMVVSPGDTKLYRRHAGAQFTEFAISVESETSATFSANYVAPKASHSDVAITNATYTQPVLGRMLIGKDVGEIKIGDTNLVYASLNLTVTQERETQTALSDGDAIGVATNANRNVTLVVTCYRADLDLDDLFEGDDTVPVSFEIGAGAEGYGFDMPEMVGSFPADQQNGASEMVEITLRAKNSDEGYDIAFTPLT